ncbi:hypothetical protein CVT24_005022 [Panaeolus cyanescens]|uniref:Uncharacterized protein n=1 Tax=Panaeolus cyanescens TaxID=181874 RepID=A0A409WG57_9AGAR|nr:hypothetical protein CVT24_005022 [Panaeolus cyanescens]
MSILEVYIYLSSKQIELGSVLDGISPSSSTTILCPKPVIVSLLLSRSPNPSLPAALEPSGNDGEPTRDSPNLILTLLAIPPKLGPHQYPFPPHLTRPHPHVTQTRYSTGDRVSSTDPVEVVFVESEVANPANDANAAGLANTGLIGLSSIEPIDKRESLEFLEYTLPSDSLPSSKTPLHTINPPRMPPQCHLRPPIPPSLTLNVQPSTHPPSSQAHDSHSPHPKESYTHSQHRTSRQPLAPIPPISDPLESATDPITKPNLKSTTEPILLTCPNVLAESTRLRNDKAAVEFASTK